MNESECFPGSYVVHPDLSLDRVVKLHRHGRPAFIDPPLVGVVEYLINTREAAVVWPGIGVRRMAICELTAAEHWLIEHTVASAKWQAKVNARERAVPGEENGLLSDEEHRAHFAEDSATETEPVSYPGQGDERDEHDDDRENA